MKFFFARKPVCAYLLFLLVLLFFSYTYYEHFITWLPFGIHEWAQSDRLSVAYYFYDNGMNIFLPGTMNLSSSHGVTGMEVPLHAYISAALGFVFGRGNIHTCFKLLDIFIMITGLFYLFRIVFKATGDFIFSMLPPLFIYCSPVYIFYGGNFLPDPAGASICFVAFYYLTEYMRNGRAGNLLMTMLLLTLASLIKTSAGLYLTGVLGFLLIRALRMPGREKWRKVLTICIYGFASAAILVSWVLYTKFLDARYGGYLFTMAARPFKDWDEFSLYLDFSFKTLYINEYLLLPQYIILLVMAAVGVILMRAQKLPEYGWQLLLGGILLSGVLGMFYTMGHQLVIHDYYIVAIFFPFFAYVMVCSAIAIRRYITEPVSLKAVRTAVFIVVLTSFFMADHHAYRRMGDDYHPFSEFYSSPWMHGGAQFLDELHVPEKEKISVFHESPPNLSLVYFNRYGYHLAIDGWGRDMAVIVPYLQQKNVRLMIADKNEVNKMLAADSAYFKAFDKVAEKGRVVVFRLK